MCCWGFRQSKKCSYTCVDNALGCFSFLAFLSRYKFHCTYGETKKLISCAIGDLNRSIETKFSVVAPFLVKMYLAEVEDYIEWDSDTESVVTAEPNTKIWKITVEKKE